MPARVPFDPGYTALVRTAVYIFAYYEWALIYLIQQFEPGFVDRFCRGAPMTSGAVRQKLQAVLDSPTTVYGAVPRPEIEACCQKFALLIDKRNALIHAHPITDADGLQTLSYQTRSDRPLPDMKWPENTVRELIQEFDDAAGEANSLVHRLLAPPSHQA